MVVNHSSMKSNPLTNKIPAFWNRCSCARGHGSPVPGRQSVLCVQCLRLPGPTYHTAGPLKLKFTESCRLEAWDQVLMGPITPTPAGQPPSPPPSVSCLASNLGLFSACGCVTPGSVSTWPSNKDTSHTGLRPALLRYDLIVSELIISTIIFCSNNVTV